MRVSVLGGGPGGLYSAILLKKAFPKAEITVHERNKPDDTFGWGVVFSDETLGTFEERDPESMARIRAEFAYWTDIETYLGGGPDGAGGFKSEAMVRSTGHGFCGLARKTLLQILHGRARELGVELVFESEQSRASLEDGCDLLIASDGINSPVRDAKPEVFKPALDWRRCKFAWLGTNKPLSAFTFVFRENEHGVWNIHAYPFERGTSPRSTWIVECPEETWRAAGLDQASEDETVRYVGELFRDHLEGYDLLTNRSVWRTFPTVSCDRWVDGKVVLLGDSAHTAHFSIGSGTKLAMEDAIALVDALVALGVADPTEADVRRALEAYQEARHVDVIKTQKAAQTSLEWFEHSGRYFGQDPELFTFNLMTRSKRITYDNLALRDPALVQRATARWNELEGAPRRDTPPMFAPLKLAGLTLGNRVVVSPMCQYSATEGVPNDWHLVHLGARASGGAGLVITEMTNVERDGRITHGCAGLWNDEQLVAWRRVVDFVHARTASKIGIQLAHAGRKASCSLPWEGDAPLRDETAWTALGPSADPFGPGWPTPRAMDAADLARVKESFVAATRRALAAGFDLVELHMAHGYLLSSFLSPLSNRRTDAYGGALANRMRYPLEVLDAVRAVWPRERPLSVRVSATDWLGDEGQTIAETVVLARELAARGCDVLDVSTAGNSPRSKPDYGRMYQVPFAEQIRYETGMRVMAVGAIQGADHANTVLCAGRADLVALARPHLADPHLTLRASLDYGCAEAAAWPNQYLAAAPRRRP
ncbi:MAG: FAD-dependent monooxygenase [Planctomycetota bacterium]